MTEYTEEDLQVVRFDWAIKTLLRDKANFDVLEGFLSAVLNEDIQVEQILESESNQEEESRKYNRVDILVTDSAGRRLIIEVQSEYESDYMERLLFGTSKVVVENLNLGAAYREIVKIISISILYFNLGTGDDYVYYGTTEFRGLHTHNVLTVKKKTQKPDDTFRFQIKNIFPEYYLIHTERFEDVIESPLDEWIYMLKHNAVPAHFTAPKIDRARDKLALLNMKPHQRKRYERYIMNETIHRDMWESAIAEGELRIQKRVAASLFESGMKTTQIAAHLGTDEETVREWLKTMFLS